MKICTLCKKRKSESEFNKNSGRKDGLQSQCRKCGKLYSKGHYRDNTQYYLDKVNKRRDNIRNWLIEYKGQLKCNRCEESRLPCLEFHHLNPKEKDFCISAAITYGYSIARLESEIAKCEVLCANCHAVEHWQDRCSIV